MASYVALPLEGHLEMIYRVFYLIRKCHNAEMGLIYLNQASIIIISKERIGAAQSLIAQ